MKFSSIILSFSALLAATAVNAASPGQVVTTCTKPGVVAWTFDDGPGKYNAELLQILARNNIKATFFILGSMVAQDATQGAAVKLMYDAGHQIASHTWSHGNLNEMTPAQQAGEITTTSDIIFSKIGVRPAYMRAPQGNCNEACAANMGSLNQIVTYWNADTNDWRFTSQTPEAATASAMAELNTAIILNSNPATDSFILLQHEIHAFSVHLLAQKVIDAIRTKGYRFVTIEECIGNPSYLGGSPAPVAPTSSAANPGPTTTSSSGNTPPQGQSNPSLNSQGVSNTGGPTVVTNVPSSANLNTAAKWVAGLAAIAGLTLF
jgi:peptidoglycan/xylan/chitin deacetylase (PgdA/CDA1 family)